MSPRFEPEVDTPPDGATVHYAVRYEADHEWWRVVAGPPGVVDRVAWTFSDEGIAIAQLYAQSLAASGDDYPGPAGGEHNIMNDRAARADTP